MSKIAPLYVVKLRTPLYVAKLRVKVREIFASRKISGATGFYLNWYSFNIQAEGDMIVYRINQLMLKVNNVVEKWNILHSNKIFIYFYYHAV